MKITTIYQTLEDKGNYDEVESHGPYFCSVTDLKGNKKTGTKIPWAGEGYYFWDTLIEDAHWWGKVSYKKYGNEYIIGQTFYDSHSPLLLDTLGNLDAYKQLKECADVLKEKKALSSVTLPVILEFLKCSKEFIYKAIRIHPDPIELISSSNVLLPNNKYVLNRINKVQICFFDKTLLSNPFKVIFKSSFPKNFTI